jgi:putative SOS response-associated peptidase YedK
MCGRITQKSNPKVLGLGIVTLVEPLYADNTPPRYNGAPGQEHWVIRQHPKTGEMHLDRLWWGLIPYWTKEAKPKLKPINATAERVASAPMFRAAYAKRRCILPIDSFFEWTTAKAKAVPKQPYAVGMRDGAPFAVAGLWESWRHPESGDVVRTFCVITTDANPVMAEVHHRMPVILDPPDYARWLSPESENPSDLMVPHSAEPMAMWPVSTRVNSVANDDAALLERSG